MKTLKLPFYYKSHSHPDNGGLPHVLPFHLSYDESLEMVCQKPTEQLDAILNDVYREGSLVDGSISSESGMHYVKPVMDYILKHTNLSHKSHLLEIGYGTGVFLEEFSQLGFVNLYGVEPGNHGNIIKSSNIKLFNDFYPSKLFVKKVDLIYHSLVFEHIKNPLLFLKNQSNQLNETGKIVFFVPNEEPFLLSGDCSSFIHEHFNYFTRRSISLIVAEIGMYLEDISIIDGLLAVTISKNADAGYKQLNFEGFDKNSYFQEIDDNINKIKLFIDKYENPSDVVVYVPGRALNSMCILGFDSLRLVDDSTEIHDKYLPFFKNPVESFESIINNPPKAILIFSRTFGKKIKERCKSYNELQECNILTLDDL